MQVCTKCCGHLVEQSALPGTGDREARKYGKEDMASIPPHQIPSTPNGKDYFFAKISQYFGNFAHHQGKKKSLEYHSKVSF